MYLQEFSLVVHGDKLNIERPTKNELTEICFMEQASRSGPSSYWCCWCYRFVAPVAAAGGCPSDGDMN